jgi:acetyl-CoA carboxylase beta subunit
MLEQRSKTRLTDALAGRDRAITGSTCLRAINDAKWLSGSLAEVSKEGVIANSCDRSLCSATVYALPYSALNCEQRTAYESSP